MEIFVEGCIKEYTSRGSSSKENNCVRKTLEAVFGGSRSDMRSFFCGLVSATPKVCRRLVVLAQQKVFRRAFLHHARRLSIEADPAGEEDPDLIPKDVPADVPPGPWSIGFRYVGGGPEDGRKFTDREYHAKVAMSALCAVLVDEERWLGRCSSIYDIPSRMAEGLVALDKPRSFVGNRILVAASSQQRIFTTRDSSCVQILDMVLREKDAETDAACGAGKNPDQCSSLVLAAYLYHVRRSADLGLSREDHRSTFNLLMGGIEEACRRAGGDSSLDVMSHSSREDARRKVEARPQVYLRVAQVACEICLYARRFLVGIYNNNNNNNCTRMRLSGKTSWNMSLLTEIHAAAPSMVSRVDRLADARPDASPSSFRWTRTIQQPWKIALQAISADLAPHQARCLQEFAFRHRSCVMVKVEAPTRPSHVLDTVRALNRKYPTFSMGVVRFEPSAADDHTHAMSLAHDNPEDVATLSPVDWIALVEDSSGSAARFSVLFSSPKAHHRLVQHSILEALVTKKRQKLMPVCTHITRMYSCVFVDSDREPPPVAKEEEEEEDDDDDEEQLSLFVDALFYMLCTSSAHRYKRMGSTLRHKILEQGHQLFFAYRLLHKLMTRIDRSMVRFPFFFFEEPSSSPEATSAECHRGLSILCDRVLCFLCMKCTHTVSGESIRILLDAMKKDSRLRSDHANLRDYLRHIEGILGSNPGDRRLPRAALGEQRRISLSFYPDEIYSDGTCDRNAFLEDLRRHHTHTERLTWINVMIYDILVDENLGLETASKVFFDMDFIPEENEKRVYWRKLRAEGKDIVVSDAKNPDQGVPGKDPDIGEQPARAASAPTTPSTPGTPLTPITKYKRVNLLRAIFPLGKDQFAPAPPGIKGKESLHRKKKRLELRAALIRQIKSEANSDHGWVGSCRSRHRRRHRSASEPAASYYGLRAVETDPDARSYQDTFLSREDREEDDEADDEEDQHHATWDPSSPGGAKVAYLDGSEATRGDVSASLAAPGRWRYVLAPAVADGSDLSSLGTFLMQLEWMLYYRSKSQAARPASEAECPWTIDWAKFIGDCANSKLPVDCFSMPTAPPRRAADAAAPEIVYIEDSLMVRGLGRRKTSEAAPRETCISLDRGSIDEELKFMFREYSPAMKRLLAACREGREIPTRASCVPILSLLLGESPDIEMEEAATDAEGNDAKKQKIDLPLIRSPHVGVKPSEVLSAYSKQLGGRGGVICCYTDNENGGSMVGIYHHHHQDNNNNLSNAGPSPMDVVPYQRGVEVEVQFDTLCFQWGSNFDYLTKLRGSEERLINHLKRSRDQAHPASSM